MTDLSRSDFICDTLLRLRAENTKQWREQIPQSLKCHLNQREICVMTATNIDLSAQRTPQPSTTPAQIFCSDCGACADAACNCGAPYMPAGQRAMKAIEANPEKSDRAIAAEIGVGKETVRRTRKATAPHGPVGKRIGKDGKERRMPVKKAKKQSPSAIEMHRLSAVCRDKRDAEAVEVIARLRENLPDNDDVMALCEYTEWYINGSPVEPTCGTDMRIWRRTYRPAVERPDMTLRTRMMHG
jgi:hypothetical protein